MIADPEGRRRAASAYIESVGGKPHGFWHADGSHDGIDLWEAPDSVSMASVVLAIGSDGGAERGPGDRLPAAADLTARGGISGGPRTG